MFAPRHDSVLSLHFLLAGAPHRRPGELVCLFCAPHTNLPELLHSGLFVLDDVRQAPGNIGVVEPKVFPGSDSAVLVHFLDVLLDHLGRKLQSPDDGSVVDHHRRPGDCHWLLNHDPEIIGNLGHVEPPQGIQADFIAAHAMAFRSIKGFDNANNEVFRIAPSSGSRSRFLRHAVNPVKLVSNAVHNLILNPLLPVFNDRNLFLLLVVEPFQGIQNRKGKGMVLRHARHVVAEHIEDGVNNNPVVRFLLELLCKAHVQQRIQALALHFFIRNRFNVTAIGIDGEVVLLSEHLFSESLHADVVAPAASLFLHELLKRIRNGYLPGSQFRNNPIRILNGNAVPGIRYLLPVCKESGNPNSLPEDMPLCLFPLKKLIEAHNLGNTHLHGSIFQLDGFHFLVPLRHFFFGIGIFGESNDFLGVESKLRLSPSEAVIDRLSAVSKPLKGIGRANLIPENEVVDAFTGLCPALCVIVFVQFQDGCVTGFGNMLIHCIDVEPVEILNQFFHGLYNLRKAFQFLRSHLIDDGLTTFRVDDCLSGGNEPFQFLLEARRQVIVPGVQACVLCVFIQDPLQRHKAIHKSSVRLGSIAAVQLPLAGEVDAVNELDYRIFQHIRNMLHVRLVAGAKNPIRQVCNVLADSVPVLLDGSGIVPPVSPPLQNRIVLFLLLLLHNAPGNRKNLTECRGSFSSNHLVFRLLDFCIQLTHLFQGFCRLFPVNVYAELKFSVGFSQLSAPLLQFVQGGKAFL